ncbi:hypothetical protein GE09DRAFT_961631 [Coniochaeta sp. 2T2.1]|nr:hypothetical protein GE09DRAFT_961631 [Coniochaeta sp. 2T2.1]
MSIQLATAPGALVALGVGVGDVASIISLGRRIGNWWTAPSGDAELLSLLDEDEYGIIKRRGLIDVVSFNRRWRKQLRLLANGSPLCLDEERIKGELKDVQKLVQFANRGLVQNLLLKTLRRLLTVTPAGEEILRSQYTSRLNAWRSMACLRGISHTAAECRLGMIQDGSILNGHFPASESQHMEDFLLWLLTTNDFSFTTSSSDVAGVAVCPCNLGIEILNVEGPGFAESSGGLCTVVYSKEPILHSSTASIPRTFALMSRSMLTAIPLQHPWESMSVFPVSIETHNKCRSAWKEGQKAAKAVVVGIVKPETHVSPEDGPPQRQDVRDGVPNDLRYSFVDNGKAVDRTSAELNDLAEDFGLIMNGEILDGLHNCLGSMSTELHAWLHITTNDMGSRSGTNFDDPGMTDMARVAAFTIFQSFFMGYYYDICGRVVDTSTLMSDVVEGAWGFRSTDFFRHIRMNLFRDKPSAPQDSPHLKVIRRQQLIKVLAILFLGIQAEIPEIKDTPNRLFTGCLGIIHKRALVTNSLLGRCSSPGELGRFTLLDVDVGGIPRDHMGLIRPGRPTDMPPTELLNAVETAKRVRHQIHEGSSSDEDLTFNIEPDWENDPDTAVVCARYKGRRLATFSPSAADYSFCQFYVPPQSISTSTLSAMPPPRSTLSQGVEIGIADFMKDDATLLCSSDVTTPVLFQALDQPRLRYAVAAMYASSTANCYVVSDCVESAEKTAVAFYEKSRRNKKPCLPFVLVAGLSRTSKEEKLIQIQLDGQPPLRVHEIR